jgi:hypothetical protein
LFALNVDLAGAFQCSPYSGAPETDVAGRHLGRFEVEEEQNDLLWGRRRSTCSATAYSSSSTVHAGFYFYQPTLTASGVGYGASRTVDAVGQGMDGFVPGHAVSTVPAFYMTEYATYRELVTVPAAATVWRQEGIDAVTSAAVSTAYATAYGTLVESGQISAGRTGRQRGHR